MKIVITAGPTREPIDPMRFISNRSTGKMGYALARAAVGKGYTVSLISGPVSLAVPEGIEKFISVITAAQMSSAVKQEAADADVIIMCAAVADYRPKKASPEKIKKTGDPLVLELERTEDILATLGKMKRPGTLLIGFAAETGNLEKNAVGKLRKKNLDWIAANRLNVPGEGAGADTNALILFSASGKRVELSLDSKQKIAEQILEITGL